MQGVSTLIAYICVILDNLRDLNSPRLVDEILNLLLTCFESSVAVLRLKCACHHRIPRSHSETPLCSNSNPSDLNPPVSLPLNKLVTSSVTSDKGNDDDVDDISWFFSDSTPATEFNDCILTENPFLPTPPLIPSSAVTKPQLCYLKLWNGLAHCLDWDFGSRLGDDERSFVLPMQIAVEAASHLLARDICTKNLKCSSPTKDHIPLLKSVSFECIQGREIGGSEIYLDTVIEFCEDKVLNEDKGKVKSPHVAAHGARVYASYQQALELQSARTGRRLSGLCRVAVVDVAVCTDDNSSSQLRVSGSGGSEQADSLQHRISHVYHSSTSHDSQEIIYHLNSRDTYTNKALTHLLDLNVQVLVCPYSVPLKLLDACFENGVCVVPMSTDNLHTMAKLVDADVVEDILDLYLECLGCRHNVCGAESPSREVRITAKDCVKRVIHDDPEAVCRSRPSVMLLVQVREGGECDTCEVENNVEPKLVFKSYANSSSQRVRHVGIVITCPTLVIGSVMEDRIRKCMSRIELTLFGAFPAVESCFPSICATHDDAQLRRECQCVERRLVPGGGVVEGLCALFLKHFHNERLEGTASSAIIYVERVQQALQDFTYTVSINNGTTRGDAMLQWAKFNSQVIQLCDHSEKLPISTLSASQSAAHLHHCISRLETNELLSLPRAISVDERHEDITDVLDLASLKLESMRAACNVVKSVLGTAIVVSLV